MRFFVISTMAVALTAGGATAQQATFVTPTPDLGQCRSHQNPSDQTRCMNNLYAGLSTTTVPGTTGVPATTAVPAAPAATAVPMSPAAPATGSRALGTPTTRSGDSAVGNAGGVGVGVGSSTGTAPGGGIGTRGAGNQGSSGTGR